MTTDLSKAWEMLDAGDVPGVIRHLRGLGPGLAADDLPGLAGIVGRAAAAAGFEDLEQASARLAAEPARPQALYDFGYACIERAVAFLAVPALRAALDLAPDSVGVVHELVAGLEAEQRHGEAVDLLLERDAILADWPGRYLLVFNAVLDGRLDLAEERFRRLPAPPDERWLPARKRVGRMLDRAAVARTASPLDRRDLRGWHFVLTGGLLSTLSPYGFEEGMTGRYAYLQDDCGQCLLGLRRLRVVLEAAGMRPRSVSLLPDRSSRILGLAAAQFLGLPAQPYVPGAQNTVVVAYDLTEVAEGDESGSEVLASLLERAPGQVLFEHASCWTSPPAIPADVSSLLVQTVVAPWAAGRMRQNAQQEMEHLPADERPVDELAAEILAATEEADRTAAAWGDEDAAVRDTDTDTDGALAGFAAAVAGRWLDGPRSRVESAGPVRSSRFL